MKNKILLLTLLSLIIAPLTSFAGTCKIYVVPPEKIAGLQDTVQDFDISKALKDYHYETTSDANAPYRLEIRITADLSTRKYAVVANYVADLTSTNGLVRFHYEKDAFIKKDKNVALLIPDMAKNLSRNLPECPDYEDIN